MGRRVGCGEEDWCDCEGKMWPERKDVACGGGGRKAALQVTANTPFLILDIGTSPQRLEMVFNAQTIDSIQFESFVNKRRLCKGFNSF